MTKQLRPRSGQAESLDLKAGEMLTVKKAKGWQLTTRFGILLVSAYGVPIDYEIETDERLEIPNNELLLVEAITDCRVLIAYSPGTEKKGTI